MYENSGSFTYSETIGHVSPICSVHVGEASDDRWLRLVHQLCIRHLRMHNAICLCDKVVLIIEEFQYVNVECHMYAEIKQKEKNSLIDTVPSLVFDQRETARDDDELNLLRTYR